MKIWRHTLILKLTKDQGYYLVPQTQITVEQTKGSLKINNKKHSLGCFVQSNLQNGGPKLYNHLNCIYNMFTTSKLWQKVSRADNKVWERKLTILELCNWVEY